MPITHYDISGLTLYCRFDDGTSVALTAGSGVDAAKYTATDSAIDTAGLGAGTFTAAIKEGSVGSQSASDPIRGDVPSFVFDGTNEVSGSGGLTQQQAQDAAEAAIDAKRLDNTIAGGSAAVPTLEDIEGGTATVSAEHVSEKRTFFVGREGNKSSSVVTLTRAIVPGKTVTLSVEPELNDGADIDPNGTHQVTVVGTETLTVTSIAVSKDGEALHFDIPSDSSVDEYVVTAEVQTVDGQSLPMTGKLVIE